MTHRVNPDDILASLVALFPVFTGERWLEHRPLKVGVGQDLLDTGLVTLREMHAALRYYCGRRCTVMASTASRPAR
jgi:sRNA-binding protein